MPNDHDDLIARCAAMAKVRAKHYQGASGNCCTDAYKAAALAVEAGEVLALSDKLLKEALYQAELEATRAIKAERDNVDLRAANTGLADEASELRTEVERLKAALVEISTDPLGRILTPQRIAREALKGKQP